MTNADPKEVLDEHAARRRALLKNAGTIAVTAPTVSLLLADGVKPAAAQGYSPTDIPTTIGRCLVEGSLVLRPNGTAVSVETCKVGQSLASLDGTTRISDVWLDHMRDQYFVINGELRITNDHPVLIWRSHGPAWCHVDRLTVGDVMVSPHSRIPVGRIERIEQVVPTVYIETEHDSYFACGAMGPYVVHGRYGKIAAQMPEERLTTHRREQFIQHQ